MFWWPVRFLVAALVIGTGGARGATFELTASRGTNTITMSGPVVKGDSIAFAKIAAQAEAGLPTVVRLSGPGGLVFEGMKIGVAIHEKKWSTAVGDGRLCLSTCAMIWLAGIPRIASSQAHIGFHAPFNARSYEVDTVALHVVKTYASLIGLDDTAIAFMVAKTPGNGLGWLDATSAKANGFEMQVVESQLHPAGRFSSAVLDSVDAAAARARAGGEDALFADIGDCYGAFRRGRTDALGFRCFALESVSAEVAAKRAKANDRKLDPRFTTKAGVRRLLAGLSAAGYTSRRALAALKHWQADLVATAAAR